MDAKPSKVTDVKESFLAEGGVPGSNRVPVQNSRLRHFDLLVASFTRAGMPPPTFRYRCRQIDENLENHCITPNISRKI